MSARVDLDGLCSKVMMLQGVRFCAVRDYGGNTLAGGQKSGIPRIETDEERAQSAQRTGLISGMLESMPTAFGTPKNLTIEFQKLRFLVFLIGRDRILQITQDPSSSDIRQDVMKLTTQQSGLAH